LFASALLVLAWNGIANARLIPPVFLPTPGLTAQSLVTGILYGDTPTQFAATLMRMIYGWLLASIVGIALGALVGSSRSAQAYLGATLEALRPLPAPAVMPVAIAFFGLSDEMVLSVVAFGAFWPLLLSTLHGFRKVEPRLFEVARVLHISRFEIARKIALPSAMPDILAGARLSLTASLAMAVAGEMLAGVDGIGQAMLAAGRMFRAPDVFAGMLLLAVIGIVTSSLLGLLERKLLRWKHLQR
jgi:ABC-type nitrate/sulfonate/bicarbonate transport system permease component